MKQKISYKMDGGLNARQLALEIGFCRAVQRTLYEYMEGFPVAEILEVEK